MNKKFNLDDINIEEYEKINVSLDEIKKKKMKRNLVGIIKRRRNNKKVLMAAVAMILIISTTNISSISALAKSIPMFNKIYEQLGFSEKYLPKSQYIGQSIEENGVRVTIDNIVGTKHMIMASIKIEKIDGTLLSKDERQIVLEAELGGIYCDGGSTSSKRIDDKTEMIVSEVSYIKELPSEGELKLNIGNVNGKDSFKKGFNLKVDFTDNYTDVIEKNFTIDENAEGLNIKKIEGTTLGALVEMESYAGSEVELILKIDNKLYKSGSGFGNSEKSYSYYPGITSEDIKNAKTISVIERVYEKMSSEEAESYTKEYYQEKRRIFEEKMNSFPMGEKDNVQYMKEFTYDNGNKAEIYNIERTNNVIKVYIKGQDKKQVLKSAMSMGVCNTNKSDYIEANKVIENNEGYVVEFNDRNAEKVEIDFGSSALEHDESPIGKEIILGTY